MMLNFSDNGRKSGFNFLLHKLATVSTHGGRVFFEVIRWPFTSFQMIAGSSLIFSIHMKYVVFYICAAQLKF